MQMQSGAAPRAVKLSTLPLFATAIFVSAALLFLLEPLFGKLVLPLLGGTSAVWTTCMLFFQAALLAAYAYAHGLSRVLSLPRQLLLHAVVVALPLLVLPIAVPHASSSPQHQTLWLLGIATVTVGGPFFALATTGPMLSRWFSLTGAPRAKDPYFLYAASNLGSLIGLLAYPTIVEPAAGLDAQSRVWSLAYGLFVVLTVACAVASWRMQRGAPEHDAGVTQAAAGSEATAAAAPRVTWARRSKWIALAFAPSSLMLGVTTYLSTDLVAMPLLWVVPLALYLVTFIVVFSPRVPVPRSALARILPLLVVFYFAVGYEATFAALAPVSIAHLSLFFVTALVCHGELARDRPGTAHLTDYYLCIAIGGVAGGIFNGAIAPSLFSSALEYPIALLAACALCPPPAGEAEAPPRIPRAIVTTIVAVVLVLVSAPIARALHVERRFIVTLLPAMSCAVLYRRPAHLAAALVAVFAVQVVTHAIEPGTLVYRERTFFGVHKVLRNRDHDCRLLLHGTTIHGRQCFAGSLRSEPLVYYHRRGPVGRVFEAYGPEIRDAAVVGLGAGAIAAYARPGSRMSFFEIDPAVDRIAERAGGFTFLSDARRRGADVRVVLGDARITLTSRRDRFDVILLDAYSSDAIPVHLLTREAMQIYLARLAPNGILLFHVSNAYMDVSSVAERLSLDASLACLRLREPGTVRKPAEFGKTASYWVVAARSVDRLARIGSDRRAAGCRARAAPAWTDDFSNPFSLIHW